MQREQNSTIWIENLETWQVKDEIGLLHILPGQSTQEVLEDVSRDHGYCKCPSDTEHIILPLKVHPFSLLALEDDQIKVIDKLRSNPIGFWEQAPMV